MSLAKEEQNILTHPELGGLDAWIPFTYDELLCPPIYVADKSLSAEWEQWKVTRPSALAHPQLRPLIERC
jgi:hypothetical protein